MTTTTETTSTQTEQLKVPFHFEVSVMLAKNEHSTVLKKITKALSAVFEAPNEKLVACVPTVSCKFALHKEGTPVDETKDIVCLQSVMSFNKIHLCSLEFLMDHNYHRGDEPSGKQSEKAADELSELSKKFESIV